MVNLFASAKVGDSLLLLAFLLEGFEQGLRFLIAFKRGDQVAILVVQRQVRKVTNPIEGHQEKFLIPAYFDIGMIEDAEIGIELFYFIERLVGSHDNLHVLEFVYLFQDRLRLMFTMIAIRAEEHDHGEVMFLQVVFGQVRGAVQFQEPEGRDGRKTLVWRFCRFLLRGRLLRRLLCRLLCR